MKKESRVKKVKWGAAGCGRFTEYSFIPALEFLRKSTINSVYSGSASPSLSRWPINTAFPNTLIISMNF